MDLQSGRGLIHLALRRARSPGDGGLRPQDVEDCVLRYPLHLVLRHYYRCPAQGAQTRSPRERLVDT